MIFFVVLLITLTVYQGQPVHGLARSLICKRLRSATDAVADPLWDSQPPGGDELILAMMPKPVTAETTEALVNILGKEVKQRLNYETTLCDDDPTTACTQVQELQRDFTANPVNLMPLQVQYAMTADTHPKVTPGLVGHISKPFLKETRIYLDQAKYICDAEANGGLACSKFSVDNGKVEFDDTVTTAHIVCDFGFKTRIGTEQDLISAPREVTLQCENRQWSSALPNCYGCEVGWYSAENVPACYRVFSGPKGNIEEFSRVCNKHLGALASIHNKEELDFIWQLMGRKPGPLVGLMKEANEDWNSATWVDGSAASDLPWLANEPSLPTEKRGCARLWVNEGTRGIESVSCDDKTFSRFLCKRLPSR